VVYLPAWQWIAEERLAELRSAVFGVEVATAPSAVRGQRKAQELAGLAAYSAQQVKQATGKHRDETGDRIAGVLQWRPVASTWLLTC
jgi:hypothetical protein